MGQNKVYSMLSQRFYWVGMSHDVKRHIAACQACRARKVEFKQPPTLHPIPVAQAFSRWHVDFMGPYPKSTAGNSYVMLMICPLTNWPEAEPLPDKSSAGAAGALLRCISRHGCPRVVVTDQGREFEGEFGDLLSSLHIEHRRSSAYHPQGNGRAERMVQTVLNALRKALAEPGRSTSSWDTRLSEILLAYRASRHNSTGYSPALLTYGRELLLPAQLAAEHAAKQEEAALLKQPATQAHETIDLCESDGSELVDQARQAHLQTITTTLETATPAAVTNIEAAQQKQVRAYHSRRGHLPNPAEVMPVGTFVRIKVPADNKLELEWEGPYRVLDYTDKGSSAVVEDATGQCWSRHVSLLAPWDG
jgi:transposase InsO family protein